MKNDLWHQIEYILNANEDDILKLQELAKYGALTTNDSEQKIAEDIKWYAKVGYDVQTIVRFISQMIEILANRKVVEGMNNLYAFGFQPINSHIKIKFTIWQRVKRAWNSKSFKQFKVKEIEVAKNCHKTILILSSAGYSIRLAEER